MTNVKCNNVFTYNKNKRIYNVDQPTEKYEITTGTNFTLKSNADTMYQTSRTNKTNDKINNSMTINRIKKQIIFIIHLATRFKKIKYETHKSRDFLNFLTNVHHLSVSSRCRVINVQLPPHHHHIMLSWVIGNESRSRLDSTSVCCTLHLNIFIFFCNLILGRFGTREWMIWNVSLVVQK